MPVYLLSDSGTRKLGTSVRKEIKMAKIMEIAEAPCPDGMSGRLACGIEETRIYLGGGQSSNSLFVGAHNYLWGCQPTL